MNIFIYSNKLKSYKINKYFYLFYSNKSKSYKMNDYFYLLILKKVAQF